MWPDYRIDHKDGNERNNKISNLREATIQQNGFNKTIQINNTSGVPGVSWRKKEHKWWAQIKIDGITMHLGFFAKFEDACQARWDAEDRYFGEFSRRISRGPFKYEGPQLF